jgi:putative membrane protein
MPADLAGPGDPRVVLAAERTLLAWVRTGLAMMGFGFVVARFGLFLHEIAAVRTPAVPARPGFSLWIGTALVLLGVLVNALAALEHRRFLRALRSAELPRRASYLGVGVCLATAAIGLGMTAYLVTLGR